MQFNLIDEAWIPVKRRDGTPDMIVPWEVTDKFEENPVIALNAPRPDFNGALIQFLIGLVQTVAAPTSRIEWRQTLRTPPSKEKLKDKFGAVRPAFELGGSGPRFMQSFEKLIGPTISAIAGLLIDAPGVNAFDNNTDHFIKRGAVTQLCPACSATALFCSQINAYGDGPGYRTSLRGGSGPLTTIVIGDEKHNTLWHLIWLNVIENTIFLNLCGDCNKTNSEYIFPWLAPTRTSEKNSGVDTTPLDVHPAQMFWSMSKRIKLNTDEMSSGVCDICGSKSSALVTNFIKKNSGVNYTGSWRHPLTPYRRKEDGTTIPAHGEKGGIAYRHWLGFVQNDNQKGKEPARVVHEYYTRYEPDWQFRLWVFGYDIYKNAKIRCWYESKMPLLTINQSIQNLFENYADSMIKAASVVAENLRIAMKNFLHGIPKYDPTVKTTSWTYKDIKKLPTDENNRRKKILNETDDKSLLIAAELFFWHETESSFYELLHQLKADLESGGDGLQSREKWRETLRNKALEIYDDQVLGSPIEDSNPKKVVIARNEMEKFNMSKTRELLNFT